MTNAPDKSEMEALERVERRLNNAWAKHGFMTLTVCDLREVVSLARASSRPPADQVPDMVEWQDGGFFYVEWRGKPCPFCGVAGVSGKSPSGHFFAGCPDADCLAHNLAYDFVTVDHARAAWNARAAIAALQAVPAASGGVGEIRDLLVAAYRTGAKDVHDFLAKLPDDERQMVLRDDRPDLAEAAHSYADAALKASGEE